MKVIDWNIRAEDALSKLLATDALLAELKVKQERDKRKAKRIWSSIFLRVTGNIEERKSQAQTNPKYETAEAAEMTSLLEYEKLRNERDTAELVIEFWRSWQRNPTQGQNL